MEPITYRIRHKKFSNEELKLLVDFTNEFKDCFTQSKFYPQISSEIVAVHRLFVQSLTKNTESLFSVRRGHGSFTLSQLMMLMKTFYSKDFEILETSLSAYELEQAIGCLNISLMHLKLRNTNKEVGDYIHPIVQEYLINNKNFRISNI